MKKKPRCVPNKTVMRRFLEGRSCSQNRLVHSVEGEGGLMLTSCGKKIAWRGPDGKVHSPEEVYDRNPGTVQRHVELLMQKCDAFGVEFVWVVPEREV